MLSIDLRGKRALVAGVADDAGYGFAITKALVEAGATVCAGTWPPALNIFQNLLERGKMDASRKLAALTAYLDHLTQQTTDSAATAELEIATLQAQIEEKRKAMTAAQQKQAQMRQLCDAESDRLDDVLEFFSLDVPPSKYAAPGEEK